MRAVVLAAALLGCNGTPRGTYTLHQLPHHASCARRLDETATLVIGDFQIDLDGVVATHTTVEPSSSPDEPANVRFDLRWRETQNGTSQYVDVHYDLWGDDELTGYATISGCLHDIESI